MDSIQSAALSAAEQELRLRSSFDEDHRRLETTLTKSRILIDRAERWSFKETRLAQLLTQLKDAAYDAEDLLDNIDYQDQQQKIQGQQSQASRLLYNSLNYLRNLINGAAKTMKTIHGRLDTTSASLEGIMDQLGLHGDYRMPANRQTSSLADEPIVYGRDEEREKVIELLGVQRGQSDNENENESASVPAKRRKKENVSVLSIYGIGGVGKTTLAQIVYNDQRVVKHFKLKIWICVSDNFDVESLSKEIIDNAGKEYETDRMNLNSLQVTLKEIVMAHRFLLILDDVWNEDSREWQKFYAPLSCGQEGSMILVTTRTLKVASIAGTVDPILLEGLSGNVYWEFFKSCAFRLKNPKDYPGLEKIGIDIAAKLKGSPLAAKTLGGLLNEDMDAGHWTTILNSELWELPQKEGDILPALRLSYLYLLPHLKRCFSFCSIFPKDYEFNKSDLVSIWVAEGFVIPQGNMLLEDIATMHLRDLTSRCFLQQSHRDPLKYVMHDLIHDLAQFVSVDECSRIDKGRGQIRIPKTVRHLSICCTSLQEKKLKELGSYNKLRSLIILPKFQRELDSVIDCWFRGLTNIRCLKLSLCKITKLPERISNLKHLRYLDVSGTRIRTLPESLCDLNILQVLNITKCPLECFPQGITRLHNMRKLYPIEAISSKIREIGELTSLQYLPQFEVGKKPGRTIGELKHMTHLRGSLRIKNLENVESKEDACQAKLDNKEYLDELFLEWSSRTGNFHAGTDVLEGLQPHQKLKQLQIKHYGGTTSPSWLGIQTLSCLSELRIENCSELAELPCLPLSLTSLVLKRVGLKSLPRVWNECPDSTNKSKTQQGSSNSGSSSLCKLHISRCFRLTSLLGLQTLTCLSELRIENCSKLTELPGLPLSLTSLVLERVGLNSFPRVWDECSDSTNESKTQQGSGNSSSSGSSSLCKLHILRCSRLTSLLGLQTLTCLSELRIKDCSELTELPGLPLSLTSLELERVGLNSFPRVGDECSDSTNESKIQQGSDNSSSSSSRGRSSSLRNLRISYCSKLTSLEGWLLPHYLPSLETFDVNQCGHLTLLPPDGFKDFVSLKTMKIRACPLLTCRRKLILPPSIKSLDLYDCGDLDQSLPGCLQNLNSLTSLEITQCPNVRSLPEQVMCQLKSLERLYVWDCKELSSLGGLDALASLKDITIRLCPKLAASEPPMLDFHDEVQRTEISLSIDRTTLLKLQCLRNLLPFIRELEIYDSSEPEMFVGEDGELLGRFKSLKCLQILCCTELNSLPTELHRLTSLQTLSIEFCYKIHSLPENGLPSSLTKLDFCGCNGEFTRQLEMYKSQKNL